MLESMRLLSNVMVIGDDQRYLTMFVTIKCQVKEVYIHNVLLTLVMFVLNTKNAFLHENNNH